VVDAGWKRLGEVVRAERSRRWPRRPDFAAHCGISVRVITAIERYERTNFSPETMAALESGLGWEPGSAARVRAGRRPLRREDPDLAELRALWPRMSPDSRRMLVAVAKESIDRRG
jgi:hypothetical protein